MKKIIGIMLAISMLLSTVSFAAPAFAGTVDSAVEFVPETATVEECEQTTQDCADLMLESSGAFASGEGTQSSPYIINTAEELVYFEKVINEQNSAYKNAYYALGEHIDLGNTIWKPVGASKATPFSGHFDGRGFSISNFKVVNEEYSGLFGFIFNGNVKDLHITNLDILVSGTSAYETKLCAGYLAGFIYSNNGTSNISGITVTNSRININAKSNNAYVGGIVGYGYIFVSGYTNITNSFVQNDITVKNATGYNYVGGIAGRYDTGSGSLGLIERCYTTGDIYSESLHSSKSGGIVGYLYSYGSAYAPEPGGSLFSSEEDENVADLMVDDIDVMIKNSFAVTNVHSLSTKYTSYVGRIISEPNAHAGTENVFYPSEETVSIIAEKSPTSTREPKVEKTGIAIEKSTFTDAGKLSSKLGFDFTNSWQFSGLFEYPLPKKVAENMPEAVVVTIDGVGYDMPVGTFEVNNLVKKIEVPGGYAVKGVSKTEGGELLEGTLCYYANVTLYAELEKVPFSFSGSMQAYLNLESIVTMTVGYKFENMTGVNPEDHFDRLGLLIWDAAEVPSDKEATYENCTNIIEGARYNKKDARFETTTEGIAAKELGDNIAFRVYYLNDDGTYSYSKLIASYSPKKYCYSQIDKKPDDKENIALMSAILNYGAEAQKYFEYKIDNLMNSELTEEQKQVKWSEDLVRSDYSIPDDKDAGFVRDKSVVTSLGGYLNLEGAIDYNFYAKVNFTPKNATIYYWTEDAVNELDVLTLENATSSEKLTWKNSRYEGKYEGQPAKEMFRTIYALLVFEREDGTIETSGVVGYSPERYCFINKDKGDKNEFLSKALVVYGDAAIAYFNR